MARLKSQRQACDFRSGTDRRNGSGKWACFDSVQRQRTERTHDCVSAVTAQIDRKETTISVGAPRNGVTTAPPIHARIECIAACDGCPAASNELDLVSDNLGNLLGTGIIRSMPRLLLYRFRYRDPVFGKVKARATVAERHEIAAQNTEWRSSGRPRSVPAIDAPERTSEYRRPVRSCCLNIRVACPYSAAFQGLTFRAPRH
jgi:hypothetical protein